MMSSIGLFDNENVRYASFSLTMDARIWWESIELKYNMDEMTWAQFNDEFNDQFFNANITKANWDQLDSLE